MGDRSGGREPKGASLKKSKKNPGSTVAKAKTKVKDVEQIIKSSHTLQPPSLIHNNNGQYFDCSCALLSRQFDRDRDRVLQRSKDEGVSGLLLWFSDVEKQSSLLDICKNSSGYCYAALGISPDNIDRTNKKMHSSWLLKIEELALSAECVAIISGLNLSREMGTHFAQESLLKSCTEIATRLHLPLLLHVASDGGSLERTIEILLELNLISENNNNNENNEENIKIILYDALSTCSGDINKINNLTKYGIYFMISAAGLTDSNDEIKSNYISCLQHIPIQQILPCTDSPWKTPQNLSDIYLRTLRNEPSNISAVIDAIVLGLSQEKLSLGRNYINQLFFDNCLKVLQIPKEEINQTLHDNIDNNDITIEKLTIEEVTNKISDSNNDNNINDNNKNNDTNTDHNNNTNIVRYNCVKCRKLIATSSDIITHSVGASRSTIFKIGQEGLCSSSIFIPYNNNNGRKNLFQEKEKEKSKQKNKKSQGQNQPIEYENDYYKIENENIHCIGCNAKIGRLSLGEATCACGAIVNGPVLRINTAKLDQFFEDTTSLNANQLTMMLSRLENELIEDNDGVNDNKMMKSKKKKKTKQKSENRGNFSSYRNKSFVPNASRTAGQSSSTTTTSNFKENESDSEDDDNDNEDDNKERNQYDDSDDDENESENDSEEN